MWKWRNWQTRKVEVLVSDSKFMRVQVPPPTSKPLAVTRKGLFFFLTKSFFQESNRFSSPVILTLKTLVSLIL